MLPSETDRLHNLLAQTQKNQRVVESKSRCWRKQVQIFAFTFVVEPLMMTCTVLILGQTNI
jgi:uncharacterized membrane protein